MYIDISTLTRNGQSYKRILLRESFRENGKVKKRTIANLSACSDEEIEAMQLALRHKNNLTELGSVTRELSVAQGPSVGAVWLIYQLASRLGLTRALGTTRDGKLALWQVIARVIDQGSRLSSVRFAANHGACDILNLEAFHEEHLYANLDWITEHQVEIENRLFESIREQEMCELFLYDVTSSYLEGEHNELAAFGYNRDGKKGKKQIVIGLLCDRAGTPLSIEVFRGNTLDTKTFGSQIAKVAERFGGGGITFVGDRGMIKGPQIEQLTDYAAHDFHYITAITKPQIEKLLRDGVFQLELFDPILAEVEADDAPRYVLRRNPERTKQIRKARQEKYLALLKFVEAQNVYLQEHPRGKVATAEGRIKAKCNKLRLEPWVQIIHDEQRTISLSIDPEAHQAVGKLDGCYVLKTDLASTQLAKEQVHERYKDLALVEWAFRTSKTVELEMRPINVRLASRTRGHVFVVMLAYRIVKELSSLWRNLDVTVEEGLNELNELWVAEVSVSEGASFYQIPKPRQLGRQLLKAANVTLPATLPNKGIHVATKKKLTKRRKAA